MNVEFRIIAVQWDAIIHSLPVPELPSLLSWSKPSMGILLYGVRARARKMQNGSGLKQTAVDRSLTLPAVATFPARKNRFPIILTHSPYPPPPGAQRRIYDKKCLNCAKPAAMVVAGLLPGETPRGAIQHLEFGTSTGLGGSFVPEGLNDNRQGLQPLFRKMNRWRAVGTPRFAAYLTAREMGGDKTGAEAPAYSRPVPLGRENRNR